MTQASNPTAPSQLVTAGQQYPPPATWHAPTDMWLDAGQEDQGFNIRKFLHSLRRTWLPSVLAGLALALTLAGFLWFLVPERYQASGLVRVNIANRGVFERNAYSVNEREYAIFKETQAQLVKSPFVLARALRDEEIRQLPLLQRRNEAPETYLERQLSVTYPGRAEFLKIGLSGPNKEEVKKIVDAVMTAYLEQAHQMERNAITERLDMLKQQKNDNMRRMREESEEIRKLADQVGAEDSEKVKAQQLIEMQQLQSLAKLRDDVRKELGELQAEYYVVNNARQSQIFSPSPHMIADALESDPLYAKAKEGLVELQAQLSMNQGVLRQGSPQEARGMSEMKYLQDMMAQREKELRPRIIERIQMSYGIDNTAQLGQLRDLDIQIKLKQKALDEAKKSYDEQSQKIQELYGTSSEMFARKTELSTLEDSTGEIASQIVNDEMTLRSPPRVELLQPAEIPLDGNFWIRWLGIVSAALGTFLATVLGFAVADYGRSIMSSAHELEKETNLAVLGKMPSVADGTRSLFGAKGRRRETLLGDCVDSVRAALTRGDKANDIDSVIVTSAVGKEGKSTLASQLAVSFAKSGKKTLLVDGDLRNPRQHLVFGMMADRGLCDVLRHDVRVEDVVQATPSENLWILPAGTWDVGSYQGLSGNSVSAILTQLRSQFDFMVVDSGPVLIGPEAMIFGQYVSGAIFATRQDHSSIEKIDEAQRRLRSVGIRVLGAVINGATADARHHLVALPAAQ